MDFFLKKRVFSVFICFFCGDKGFSGRDFLLLALDTTKCELLLLFAATQYKHETLTQFSTNVAENRKKVMGIRFICHCCSEISPAANVAFAALAVVGLLNTAVAVFLL